MDDPFSDEVNCVNSTYSDPSTTDTEVLESWSRPRPHNNSDFRRAVEKSTRRFDAFFENAQPPNPLPPRTAKLRTYLDMQKGDRRRIDWRGKPEFPSIDELTADKSPKLPNNVLRGQYPSTEDYLGTQYELTREDAIRPLRDTIAYVRDNPGCTEDDYPGLGYYDKVYIVGITFSVQGVSTRVAFSAARCGKKILWNMSKRLLAGTVVVLSPVHDMFRSHIVVARVAARPTDLLEKDYPEIDLVFVNTQDLEFDPLQQWAMLEHRGSYFEAERYTLLGLQQMMRQGCPPAVDEHLVNVKKTVGPPEYLLPRVWSDLSPVYGKWDESEHRCLETVDMLDQWPEGPAPNLDDTQEEALRRMLTKKLSIIQGPPGTGKTHVSVQALKVLLANHRPTDPPIVIACQTNHALDQLLRHVANIDPHQEPPFIRLGSRTQDKLVRKRTMYEIKDQLGMLLPGKTRRRAMKTMDAIEKQMLDLLSPYLVETPEQGILSHLVLCDAGFLSQAQAESLEDDWATADNVDPMLTSPMARWLRGNLLPVEISVRPRGLGLSSSDQYDAEELHEHEAEELKIGDVHLNGNFKRLGQLYTVNVVPITKKEPGDEDYVRLLTKPEFQDLNKVPMRLRGNLYAWMAQQFKARVIGRLRALAKLYNDAVNERRIGKMEEEFPILKAQKIIGCTLTGFNKHRASLATLGSNIVLIEEAAEVLEGPVTATFLPSVEHTILVGDHQQLKPHCHLKLLEYSPYHFNTSLFERLVDNGVEYTQLRVQRRMKPEISRLLYTIYGGHIKDHESVRDLGNRPDVPGAKGVNSCFIHHTNPEERDELCSYFNPEEAKMIVRYCAKFVQKGLRPEQVTVLTFYNGQRKAIIKAFSEFRETRPFDWRIKVVTVDSYQGEENDVIFLSLVRNNKNKQLGFVSNINRICVALSRARCGLYILGNAKMMRAATAPGGVWNQTVNMMENRAGNQRNPPAICPIRVAYGGLASHYNRWAAGELEKKRRATTRATAAALANTTVEENAMSDEDVGDIAGLNPNDNSEITPKQSPIRPCPGKVYRETPDGPLIHYWDHEKFPGRDLPNPAKRYPALEDPDNPKPEPRFPEAWLVRNAEDLLRKARTRFP